MAHRHHSHAPRPAAAALASLLYLPMLAAACGSETDGDAGESANSMGGRRQRSDSSSEGTTPSNPSSGESDIANDAEVAQEGGELDGAAGESEDPQGATGGEADEAESLPARVFAACVTEEGAYEDCSSIYVTMQQSEPPQCVQLTLDNCGSYGRRTLGVDAPPRWDLISGSIGTNPDDCELGDFNASNTVITDASGTIGWDEVAAAPTELVLELTLQPSRTGGDVASVDLATSEPLDVAECPE